MFLDHVFGPCFWTIFAPARDVDCAGLDVPSCLIPGKTLEGDWNGREIVTCSMAMKKKKTKRWTKPFILVYQLRSSKFYWKYQWWPFFHTFPVCISLAWLCLRLFQVAQILIASLVRWVAASLARCATEQMNLQVSNIAQLKGIAIQYGYGSIPIDTIFSGMNIHLPAILMFTRGIGFWPIAIWNQTTLCSLPLSFLCCFFIVLFLYCHGIYVGVFSHLGQASTWFPDTFRVPSTTGFRVDAVWVHRP